MAFVTKIINAVMRHHAIWDSSAIFLAWDGWDGFYAGASQRTRWPWPAERGAGKQSAHDCVSKN